jgi:hypothetical protein
VIPVQYLTWSPVDTPPTASGKYLTFQPSSRPEERIFMGEYDAADDSWRVDLDGAPLGPTHWMGLPPEPECVVSYEALEEAVYFTSIGEVIYFKAGQRVDDIPPNLRAWFHLEGKL